MRRFILLGALSAVNILGALAEELPAPASTPAADPSCVDSCLNATREKFLEFGCSSATEAGCLCASDNFKFSVRDCSLQTPTCEATEEQSMQWIFGGFCKDFAPKELNAPETTPAETTTAEPATTTSPTTIATEKETSAPQSTPTTVPLTTEATTTPKSTSVASSTLESAPTTTAAATITLAPGQDQSGEGDEEGASVGGSGGLSQGAAVGIGVGVTVIVIVIAVAAIAVFVQRRRNQRAARAARVASDISRPMPGSGRYNVSIDNGSYVEKRGGESIEMTANRYEDMVPSQTPRTMV